MSTPYANVDGEWRPAPYIALREPALQIIASGLHIDPAEVQPGTVYASYTFRLAGGELVTLALTFDEPADG